MSGRLEAMTRMVNAQRTPRERAMLAIMVATAAVSLAVWSADFAASANAQSSQRALERAALETRVAAAQDKIAVAAADNTARAAMRASMGGETIHIARARAQSVVTDLALQSGLNDVDVTIAPRDERRKPAPGGVEPIELTLASSYDRAALARFLQSLGGSEHSLTPLAVQVRDDDIARLEMRILAYFAAPGETS